MNNIKSILVGAAIAYDKKQIGKPGHNIWALSQYFERINDVCDDIQSGAPIDAAIVAGFSGRLASALLKATKQRAYTINDSRGGIIYQPVSGT